jgi:UDP-perosamine 4-acetyltransferase
MPSPCEQRVLILGAGGHARVLLAILQAQGVTPVGYIAPQPADSGLWPEDIPHLGGDDLLERLDPGARVLVNGLGSTGRVRRRREVFERAREAGFVFRGLRHRSAMVDPSADIDETALIMAGAVIQCGVQIGANVLVNTGAVVDHDCRIGAHSHIATGARLAGEVTIGESAHIGSGATVIQQIDVGRGSVVGAGAVVIRPVEADAVHVGIPARLLPRQGS